MHSSRQSRDGAVSLISVALLQPYHVLGVITPLSGADTDLVACVSAHERIDAQALGTGDPIAESALLQVAASSVGGAVGDRRGRHHASPGHGRQPRQEALRHGNGRPVLHGKYRPFKGEDCTGIRLQTSLVVDRK